MRKWFLGLVMTLLIGTAWAAPWVGVSDVVAGENVEVRLTSLLDNEELSLTLDRPDGSVLEFSQVADGLGKARFSISGFHTRQAGEYTLHIGREIASSEITEHFTVYPGAVSAHRSEVRLENTTAAADGESEIIFRIALRDAYSNPIPGEKVQVISSRNSDWITIDSTSDEAGLVRGRIKSDVAGISILSVLAEDVVLYEKPELVFHLSGGSETSAVGAGDIGDFLKAQLFEDPVSGEIAYFTIEDLPSQVIVGKNATVRVIAKDENGDVVKAYDGALRFSSSDNRAELPLDYTYVEEDQGQHSFFLALRFGTVGEQTLAVHDLNDFRITGEAEILVLNADGTKPGGDETVALKIITPQEGTYRSNRLTITGEASGLESIKIMDGPIVLVENLAVDESGAFVYQTPTLADGIHRIVAMSLDGTVQSKPVSLQIDRTPPSTLSVELVPDGTLTEGQDFQVIVGSSEPMSAARCTFHEVKYDLDKSELSTFEKTLKAPMACGEYPLSCEIEDLIGNKLDEPNAGIIKVCGDKPDNTAPTAVSNLTAEPGEGKVILVWSPALDDKGVDHYRVNYGLTGEELSTFNDTPDNRTQWYVDGLEACEKYEFTVTPIDNEGLDGTPSNVVETGPECDMKPAAQPQSGPGGIVVAIISVLVGLSMVVMVRARG